MAHIAIDDKSKTLPPSLLFEGIPVLPFDEQAAMHYGIIRANLTQRGLLIGPNDLQIAAVALRHGATVVTHNQQEFSRVPGLLLEDWEM